MAGIVSAAKGAVSSGLSKVGSTISSGVNKVSSAYNTAKNTVMNKVNNTTSSSGGSTNSSSSSGGSSGRSVSNSNSSSSGGLNANLDTSIGSSGQRLQTIPSDVNKLYYSGDLVAAQASVNRATNEITNRRAMDRDIRSSTFTGTPHNPTLNKTTGTFSYERRGNIADVGRYGGIETVNVNYAPLRSVKEGVREGGLIGSLSQLGTAIRTNQRVARDYAGDRLQADIYDVTVYGIRAARENPTASKVLTDVSNYVNAEENREFKNNLNQAAVGGRMILSDPVAIPINYGIGRVAGVGSKAALGGLKYTTRTLSPYVPKIISSNLPKISAKTASRAIKLGSAGLGGLYVDQRAGDGAGYVDYVLGRTDSINPDYGGRAAAVITTEIGPFGSGFGKGFAPAKTKTGLTQNVDGTVNINLPRGGRMTGTPENIANRVATGVEISSQSAYRPRRIGTPSGQTDIYVSSRPQGVEYSSVGNPYVRRTPTGVTRTVSDLADGSVFTVPVGRSNRITVVGAGAQRLNRAADSVYGIRNMRSGLRSAPATTSARTTTSGGRVINAKFVESSPINNVSRGASIGRSGGSVRKSSGGSRVASAQNSMSYYGNNTISRGGVVARGQRGNALTRTTNPLVTVEPQTSIATLSSTPPATASNSAAVASAYGMVTTGGGIQTLSRGSLANVGGGSVAKSSGGAVANRSGVPSKTTTKTNRPGSTTTTTQNPPWTPPLIPIFLPDFNYDGGSGGGGSGDFFGGSGYSRIREIVETTPNYGKSKLRDL